MDRKNLLVIVTLLMVIAVVAVLGITLPRQRAALPTVTVTDPGGILTTVAPQAETISTETRWSGTHEPAPAAAAETAAVPRAWLLITVDGKSYAPYPLTKTGDYTVNQKQKNAKNVIHVTPDSIRMASSTCDNQLCVTEGVVTLDNKASRVLGNYIICLPNGVTLELLDRDEYAALQAR